MTTPWQYSWAEIWYGATPPSGWYATEAELFAVLVARTVPGWGWCSMTHTYTHYDTSPILGRGDLPKQLLNTAHFDKVTLLSANPPCQNTSDYNPQYWQLRSIVCPASYTLIYEPGPPKVGPYCALPWANVSVGKLGDGCEDGQRMKGNPCEALSGNKKETVVDYEGHGPFPLRLVRQYNSLVARDSGAGVGIPSSPLGVGWTANYFQQIRYSSGPIGGTAFVFRPDGRILTFNQSGNDFIGDADIQDRLDAQRNTAGDIVGWDYRTQADEVETYAQDGRLLSITNRQGLKHTLAYVGVYVATVTDSFGRQLIFNWDAATLKNLSSVTLPDGTSIGYARTSIGNLQRVTYPDGNFLTYLYEIAGQVNRYALTGVTDEAGARYATWGYESSALQLRVLSSQHAGGVDRYTFAYSSGSGRTVVDPLGTSRTYGTTIVQGVRRYTSSSQPCDGCNEDKSRTYDANANATARLDFKNNESRYSYDLTRNLETSRTEAFGTPRARTIHRQWHPTYRLPTQTDAPGKRTTFGYDASGNLLAKTELDTSTSESRTWSYTYNSVGQVLTADGSRTDVADITTYTYYGCTTGYQCGQVNTITNALGHVTTYNTYNAHGQPLTITDPNGVVTTLTYDLRQRLTSRTVGTEQNIFEYWPTGLLKKATLPDGSFISYTYDAAHRLVGISDSEGNRIAYTLDAMGNRTKEDVFDPSNALTQTRTRVFNTLNRLAQEIGAAGTPAVTTGFGYDNNGNQTSISAPLARNTVQAYDELNRLTQVTDPSTGLTQYGYNALDQLISVTDPRSKVTSYSYNALGDLIQQASPDTGTTGYTYDSAGNLQTKADARSKTGTYSYDALNRVTQLSYPDQTITYSYDQGANAAGRLSSLTDASGSTSWTYDAQGRVASRQQMMGGVSKTVGYAYNGAGQLQSVALPSGTAISYGYQNGRVTSLTLNGSIVILSNVLYQPFGPMRGWTWGNATLAVREYDTDGKVTDIDSAGLKTYAYDDAFRITGITDPDNAALSQTYSYDLLDRLTAASSTGLNQSWTYDANGNRLTEGGAQPSTYTIATTNNRISSISGSLTRSYGYDAAGNTTGDGTATYTYDDAGRMVSATKAGVTAAYKLNALGQRVRKTMSAVNTYFVYDEAGHLLGEYDDAGSAIQETVWLGDTPVATLRPNGSGGVDVFNIHTDHLNTPRRITRPSDNATVWRWDSDPFGTTAPNQNPSGLGTFGYNLRFPGQYYDSETGLNQNYFRDYDYQTARYAQSDPIGLAAGTNTYGYVGANPISFFDPTGLLPTDFPSERELQGARERDCARRAMLNNYNDMLRANWRFSDRYFHCKGNCEAARCGSSGFDEACSVGNFRELYGLFKGDPRADSRADEAANRAGREGASNHPTQTCQVICAGFRPRGLPAQF